MTAESDRELFEYAAKAAGLEIALWLPDGTPRVCYPNDTVAWRWSPRDEGGDSQWLAVKLNLRTVFHPVLNQARVNEYHASGREWVENAEVHADAHAAMRRAIVRAAAAIGKEMP